MRTLVPGFLTYREAARAADPAARERSWRERSLDRHPEVAASYERHLFPGAIPAALARSPALAPLLPGRAERLRAAIGRATPAVLDAFGLDAPARDWVAMVGACSSDDLLPRRRMPAGRRARRVLVAHESAHAAHYGANAGVFEAEAWSIADALFVEGLAVVASPAVVPGAAPSTALWASLAALPDGMPIREWPAACEAAWPALRSDLARATETAGSIAYRTRVLGRRDDETFPLRAGYDAGWRLAAALRRDVPIAELARRPLATVRSEAARLLAPHGIRPGMPARSPARRRRRRTDTGNPAEAARA